MAYKLAVLEILRNLFVLAYIACPRYPYIQRLPTLWQKLYLHSYVCMQKTHT